jgi:hypothetical protein
VLPVLHLESGQTLPSTKALPHYAEATGRKSTCGYGQLDAVPAERRQYHAKSWSGAARPMKMGTILSPLARRSIAGHSTTTPQAI